MSADSRWDDLRTRVISGVAMIIVGVAGVAAGGVWFQMLTVFVTAVMIWELWMMIEPTKSVPGMLLAAGTASVLSGLFFEPGIIAFALAPPIVGALALRRERLTFALFALAIIFAGWELVVFRSAYGTVWIFWLIIVVVMTDVAGYFAGRMLGGPKFWPRVSPKKTWSGTVAGWIGAAIVGVIFMSVTETGAGLILASVLVSFASQLGDIAESALKRRMKVKDSSTLIPGHGGLFDRFDGLLGASLMMLIVAPFVITTGAAS
ncbi:MAG: phosphatidate cytidylyltransferase [Rhodobacteraceae bacterium]|nr:phosphatidate cytidylyltransferase [Paracoccaceae bacterium]